MSARRGYWVLNAGGYADTETDYVFAATRADVRPVDWGYLDNPIAHVFAGEREPWSEEDAYPDWCVSFGVRGGMRWERA